MISYKDRRGCCRAFRLSVGKRAERQKQVWEDFFSIPSEKRDNMLGKGSHLHPDSSHKSTRVDFWLAALGIDGQQQGGPGGLQGRSSVELGNEVRSLCAEGQLDRALDVLLRMDQQGIVPSETIYWSLLKACNKRKALTHAKRVHAHLAQHGLASTFLGEYLVVALSKCGGLEDALQVFHRLPHRTVFSWTAVISGYTDRGKGHEALKMFQCMLEEGVDPNEYTSVSLFKACGTLAEKKEAVVVEGQSTKVMTLEVGMALHVDACKKGFDSYVFVGNTVVSMYGKCWSIVEAENVFLGLSQRNVVSWNAMLSAYIDQGEVGKALQLYWQMQEEGISPNERTFVVAIQGCWMHAQKEEALVVEGQLTKVTSLKIGQALHADAQKKGFDSSIFVGSILVSMYGKCGSIVEAEKVFGGLLQRNVVSWAAMLSAYVEQGEGEKALQQYRKMQEEGVLPNERTFVILLQACCMLAEKEDAVFVEGFSIKVKAMEIGQSLHADIQKKGLDTNAFVGSTLVNMYGKCGNITEAENVFHGLSHHNVVSWTAMLSAYVEQDEGEKALQMYRQMQEDGMHLDERIYVILLQVCCTLAEKEEAVIVEGRLTKVISLKIGQALHADLQRKGFDLDVFVGSTLVSMYGKCGSIAEAEDVFDGLSKHNVVSSTAMLSAYVEQGKGKKALQLYRQMRKEGMSPMEQTFLIALQACCTLAEEEEAVVEAGQWIKAVSLKLGRALHADASRKGFDPHVFVGNTLISMYGNCGSIVEAENVFGLLSQPNVVSWNAMLSTYVEQGEGEKALQLYRQMEEEGVTPDERTFVITLKVCCILAEREAAVVEEGQSTKIMALDIGLALHADAQRKGFDTNVFVSNALISMYGKCGSIWEAEIVFGGLSQCNIVSWNAMLSIYVEQGEGDKALQLYRQLQEDGVILDDTTLVCVLQACSDTGRVEVCWQIHLIVVSAKYDPSLVLSNTLIHAYGSCASMVDAQVVFDALPCPDVVSWTSLIAGYAREGDCGASLKSFEEMQLAGIKPNGVTFLSILSACSHAGLVDKGLEHFESMSRDYGVTPGIEHYGSMVDLLGRAGDFVRVEDLLSRMPMQPDLAMWLCLLGACQKHGNVQVEKQALDHARYLTQAG